MNVGFVGMSHLGLNSSVAAAHRGANVVCFDQNASKIAALRLNHIDIKEPNLNELIVKHQERISFTNEMEDLSVCEIVYVALDVETDDAGNSNLEPLKELIHLADKCLPENVLLVVLSQIPPGFSRSLKLNSGREYIYQVETLIFGEAINRAVNPERFIVGTANPDQALPESYTRYLALYDCPILPMRFESAELCKISINCCLVASVSIANTLAEICEKVGADWSEIVPALKSDRRIGQYSYLSPGLGIAGGNLERDLNTVQKLAASHDTDSSVISAYQHNSLHRKSWPLRTLKDKMVDLKHLTVAVWGLTYKVDTHSLKNSPSIHFIESITKESEYQVKLSCFDPVVAKDQVSSLPGQITESPLEACANADVLIVMTPWTEFTQVLPVQIAEAMSGNLVLDPYRALNQKECESAGLNYLTLGTS